MEIGISSNQLIDTTLNLVGFLAAGMLLTLIRSLFPGRKPRSLREAVSNSATRLENAIPTSGRQGGNEKSNLEYINLKGVVQSPREDSRHDVPKPDCRIRNRQEIIRLAKEMLANMRGEGALKESLPITDNEISLIKQNLNLQGAGGSRR